MRKTSLLLAAGVGYVLGTRAGRERYDQIVAQTKKLVGSQPVQSGMSKAGDTIKTQAPVVKDKVTDTIKTQAPVVKDKVSDAAHKVTGGAHSATDDADIEGTYSSTPTGTPVDVDEGLAWTTAEEGDAPR
ncbi:hypothetical protein CLV56_0725 [Mumia flava]|uniref:Uncharacterized protein n=1 Tax=Mumia flava TaxID=1348852 RepID=A0A2M9BEZ3_9ACTN|nr:hypothetical protein [Mumia flava]PJJ56516.1 hypothetical protein CLV56_0725 [Mumia flava]